MVVEWRHAESMWIVAPEAAVSQGCSCAGNATVRSLACVIYPERVLGGGEQVRCEYWAASIGNVVLCAPGSFRRVVGGPRPEDPRLRSLEMRRETVAQRNCAVFQQRRLKPSCV